MNGLNKKLAEWAGLCFHEWEVVDDTTGFPYSRCRKCLHCGLEYSTDTDEYLLPKCADGEVYFDESLDACFKHLEPKLEYYELRPSYGKHCAWVKLPRKYIEFGMAETPALAFCLAIEKLIDEGGLK